MPKRRPDHVPTRTCAVCRTSHPKREMHRVVRGAATGQLGVLVFLQSDLLSWMIPG